MLRKANPRRHGGLGERLIRRRLGRVLLKALGPLGAGSRPTCQVLRAIRRLERHPERQKHVYVPRLRITLTKPAPPRLFAWITLPRRFWCAREIHSVRVDEVADGIAASIANISADERTYGTGQDSSGPGFDPERAAH